MLSLFEKYKREGKITEALLVGRNLFNRNPENDQIFSAYFAYLCTLAETLPSLEDRENFAEQANVVLAFYTENAILTSNIVEVLLEDRRRIDKIYGQIEEDKAVKIESERTEIESHNSDCLKELYALKDPLQRATAQEELDDVLSKVGKLDNDINKNVLTDKQSAEYDTLTKDITELISAKMRQLEHDKNIDYNERAVKAFASAYNKFRDDESKYNSPEQLYLLVSKTLFAFDTSRLFNETLIYFNHVYSYIFSKIDDDGKLNLTKYSIECERKLR